MSNAGKTLRRLTYAEISAISRLYNEGKTYEAIAAETGLRQAQVRGRLHFEFRSGQRQHRPRDRQTRSERLARRRKQEAATSEHESITHLGLGLGNGPQPADVLLRERDHRMMLAPRDLTAALLGDPLPGYSALDRREP